MVTSDLQRCGLKESWRERGLTIVTHGGRAWPRRQKSSTLGLRQRSSTKNEDRSRCAERELQSESALDYDWPGCDVQAINRSGLVNHQSHITLQLIPCL